MKNVLNLKQLTSILENKIKNKDFWFSICIIDVMAFYALNKSITFSGHIRWMIFLGLCLGGLGILISLKPFYHSNILVLAKKDRIAIIYFCVVACVTILCFWKNNDTRMIIAIFLMICVLNMSLEKVINLMFYTKLAGFLSILLINEYGHINSAALEGGITILLYICMRGAELKKLDYFILLSSYLGLILYTRSGIVIIGIGVAFLILFVSKFKWGKRVCESKVMLYVYPICLLLNILAALGVGKNQIPVIGRVLPGFINKAYLYMIKFVDTITSSRLTLAQASLRKFGVSLLGGNVDYNEIWPGTYFNLDSGMMWLLQQWGILMTIVFMSLSIILMRYLIKEKRYHYVAAAISIALWATQEDMLVCVGTNFLIALAGQAIRYNLTKGNAEI